MMTLKSLFLIVIFCCLTTNAKTINIENKNNGEVLSFNLSSNLVFSISNTTSYSYFYATNDKSNSMIVLYFKYSNDKRTLEHYSTELKDTFLKKNKFSSRELSITTQMNQNGWLIEKARTTNSNLSPNIIAIAKKDYYLICVVISSSDKDINEKYFHQLFSSLNIHSPIFYKNSDTLMKANFLLDSNWWSCEFPNDWNFLIENGTVKLKHMEKQPILIRIILFCNQT